MADPEFYRPPEQLNIADYFLDDRIREGLGGRRALLTPEREYTYRDVQELANRFASLLVARGVQPEQRVALALPDGADYAGALFGALKAGAAVVMLNPFVSDEEISYFYGYTDATAVVTAGPTAERFLDVARAGLPGRTAPRVLIDLDAVSDRADLDSASPRFENHPTHRDDPAIWLFSGGTTGAPKGVVQPHRSFANTTECYAKRVIGYRPDDITLSVPKLFFGYATGSNLLFPFAVGATAALFPDRCTPAALFDAIDRFQPTILINVPTMVNQMLGFGAGGGRDLASLRLATSAGEALPVELHQRWNDRFGVELLDGLGTAEMWHIFLSNRPGDVQPGTLGRPVPGFDVRVRDDDGIDVQPGEVGWLWVRGGSRALGYWRALDKTAAAFRGEWYVSGDMVARDADGYFRYGGRGDDMLKVKGKWLSPREVEGCLLEHSAVADAAVVGYADADGLMRPWAWVTLVPGGLRELDARASLSGHLSARLASFKCPAGISVVDELPRTHLGKVDRGELRRRTEHEAAE